MIAANTSLEGNQATAQDLEKMPPPQPNLDGAPILGRLLRMADGYLDANAFHQAMALYFQLVEQFPESTQAGQARDRLLDIATHHEAVGEMHQALSIYERLL